MSGYRLRQVFPILLTMLFVLPVSSESPRHQYSIGRVRPGYTMVQVKRALGIPKEKDKYQGIETWFYFGKGGFTVDFARAVVTRISGVSLYDGNEIVLQRGDSKQKALRLLGDPLVGGSRGSASQFRYEHFRLYVTILDNNVVESIELMR